MDTVVRVVGGLFIWCLFCGGIVGGIVVMKESIKEQNWFITWVGLLFILLVLFGFVSALSYIV